MLDPGKLRRSFGYALQGIAYCFATQQNMRIHGIMSLLALLISAWVGIAYLEWALILLCIGWVMGLEMLNTALEATLDRISTEHHPLIGHAKDAAAGAVFLAAMTSVGVGLLVWASHLLKA